MSVVLSWLSNLLVAELLGFSMNCLAFLAWCSRGPNKKKTKKKIIKSGIYPVLVLLKREGMGG